MRKKILTKIFLLSLFKKLHNTKSEKTQLKHKKYHLNFFHSNSVSSLFKAPHSPAS